MRADEIEKRAERGTPTLSASEALSTPDHTCAPCHRTCRSAPDHPRRSTSNGTRIPYRNPVPHHPRP
ncbi:hypothetical protein, partial [Streptomyces acidiscabies]|uniref:hypothetical protein n=1 Tax=Streptomyces acidiscabies TaxID=42234 RepID=UPI00211697E0